MGKRLTCPLCGVENEHDVPLREAMAPQREVACRACGRRFVYGFAPEYVTEREPIPQEMRSPDAPYDGALEVGMARDRLTRHVMRHREYHDRDRDILLLHLLDMIDHLDEALSGIKRVVDVIAKRSAK